MSFEQVYFNKQISRGEKKIRSAPLQNALRGGKGVKKRVPNQYRLFIPN